MCDWYLYVRNLKALIINFGEVFAYIDIQNVRVKDKMSEQYPECPCI